MSMFTKMSLAVGVALGAATAAQAQMPAVKPAEVAYFVDVLEKMHQRDGKASIAAMKEVAECTASGKNARLITADRSSPYKYGFFCTGEPMAAPAMPAGYKTKGMADREFNAMADKIAEFLDRDDASVDGKRKTLGTWIQSMKAGQMAVLAK